MAEGYQFTWRASDGRTYSAPLLTPPDLEAVQRADGSWFRTLRQNDRSDPATFTPWPYTERFYAEYLHHHGLPAYFLRDAHLVMLRDGFEARRLGLMNAPSSQYTVIPRSDYLNLRYPGRALWPKQEADAYRIEIQSEDARASLARYHPASSVTAFEYHTYVLPSGHIQLRSITETGDGDTPVQVENSVNWVDLEDGQRIPSSYHQEATGVHLFSQGPNVRDVLIQSVIDRHGIINPMQDIPGQGHLAFLSAQDSQLALDRGYVDDNGFPDPREVNAARMREELAIGTGPRAGPIVVFWPDPDFLNPSEQPEGPGAWRFLTNEGVHSERGLAAINFGGNHGLPAYPTASQIRRLGELLIDNGREDLTAHIDIVWVPGQEDADPGEDPGLDGTVGIDNEEVSATRTKKQKTRPTSSSASNVSSPPVAGDAEDTIGTSHPHHDPTNNNGIPGSMHDQTGHPNRAEYETVLSDGRWHTIDRSRVWPGIVEPHKFWSFSARGWVRWRHADTMDWTDKEKCERLNKHREQTRQRAGIFEKKRPTPRQDYTKEENEFIFDLVAEADGNKPSMPIPEIARLFNSRFGHRVTRNDSGIASLVDRLRKMYNQYGELVEKPPRGWKQQQASKELRGISGTLEAPDDEQDIEEGEGGEEIDGSVDSDAEGEEEVGGESEGEPEDEDAEGESDE